MRFGTSIAAKTPEDLAIKARELGYTALPVDGTFTGAAESRRHYVEIMRRNDIQLAEVGAWSNPMSPDAKHRQEAMENCKRCLALAEDAGARCCVNIAGSVGERWDGPHPGNLTRETFDKIVEVVREIIDAVKPTRTFYTLETMPWMYPDSVDSYVALIKAIDRKACAVHFDPVNLVSSPQLYFNNAALIRDFVARLGEHIRCVHCKDIIIRENLTVHLDECRPGLGALDHATLFRELDKLDPETPVLMEHLPQEEYAPAAKHLREVAATVGVKL